MTTAASVATETSSVPGVESQAKGRARIPAIDVLRGLVMVVMVLDHARDFYFGAQRISPTDLSQTTPVLFFTRWVTHFCAPVFVFLAGTAAYIYAQKKGTAEAASFLRTRGLFLVLLEITVIRLCWFPDPGYHFTLIQVIWAVGWSMVLLSFLVGLGTRAVFAVGAVITLFHDLLTPVKAAVFGKFDFLWTILFARGMLEPIPEHRIFISYSVIPWTGVIALGYAFGAVMSRPREERIALTRKLGLAVIAFFILLRATNLYGDPKSWLVYASPMFTVMSFLNCNKYPPSLLFLSMTLGPALVILSALDRGKETSFRPLRVLGSVPLFFYVAHLALLRYTSAPLAFSRFGPAAFKPPPGHAGSPEYDLPVTYLAWILAVLVLYPLAAWFAKKKETSSAAWLRYL